MDVKVETGSKVSDPYMFILATMNGVRAGAAPRGNDKCVAEPGDGHIPAIHCAMEALLEVLAEQGGQWALYPPPLPEGPGGLGGVGGGKGFG